MTVWVFFFSLYIPEDRPAGAVRSVCGQTPSEGATKIRRNDVLELKARHPPMGPPSPRGDDLAGALLLIVE